jgi:hypothetical protein
MVPSYSLLQVQEDRIPRFRGVRENVDSRPDYIGFQDGLVSWPRDCRRNEWRRTQIDCCQTVATRCQAVNGGARKASTVWRQVATPQGPENRTEASYPPICTANGTIEAYPIANTPQRSDGSRKNRGKNFKILKFLLRS